jgi:nicotinamide-nucleotide amidase
LRIAILATGHEVVAGDILNTNTQKLAYDLSSHGLDIVTHMACRDVLDEMLIGLNLLSDYDVLLTIGGLGPTSDDITRFAVAQFLELDLIEHSKARKHIQQYLKHQNLIAIQHRNQETLFPKDAVLLDNPNGTAMGAWIEKNKKIIVMLPGPPRECLPMWEQYVLPELIKRSEISLPWMRWLVFGIPEAALIDDLDHLLKNFPHELSYRCSMPYVEVKVKADMTYRADIAKQLNLFFRDKILLENQVASLALKTYLETHTVEFSISDQLTGGQLEAAIMSPQIYQNVYFHEKRDLHIQLSGLHDYWHQIEPMQHLGCFMQIQDQLFRYEPLFSSQNLPCYAMEWAAFSILQYLQKSQT